MIGEPSAASEGRIVVERRGALLLVGIDRTAKRNGFTPPMFTALAAAFQRAEDEEGVRVSVLHAFGDHFSAGLQLDLFEEAFRAGLPLAPPQGVDPFQLRPPWRAKPCVAAMQGACYTIAIEMMLAADVVVAASDCRFRQLEPRRGIMANHGGAFRMIERAGWGGAMRWLLTGDEFDAETALRLGFVQEVVAPGAQLGRAIEIAERIAECAPLALAAILANGRAFTMRGFDAAVAELGPVQARLMETGDAAAGLQSFRERGTARFKGR
jgi:enoyl-CoA hydratase/carnithine racemase